MIVKMKKVTLLVAETHRDAALKKMRKLGVLHVRYVKTPVSEDIQTIQTKLQNVDRALQIIGEPETEQSHSKIKDVQAKVDHILALNQEKDSLQRELDERLEIQQWFKTWSDVSYHSIQQLKQVGIFVRFYTADKSMLKKLSPEKIIRVVKEEQGTVYFVLFGESPEDRLDLKEESMPEIEPAELASFIAQLEKNIEKIDKELKELAKIRPALLAYKADLEKILELFEVKYSMGEEGEIAYLQGFCPIDTVADVKNMADKNGWAYVIQDPDDPSEVPTLTKNPRWVNMIKPLFDFMGTLPGYNELDVSGVFLIFFSIFYAMIVGDAGYGFIFLIGTFLFARKKKDSSREFINMMYLMSFTTIIWGLITGTWFGSERISQLPFLNMFVIDKIYSFNPDSQFVVMQLSFLIGVIQLSIGHLMAAFKKMNTLNAIAEIGWVFVLWAIFFVANNVVLGKEMAPVTMPFLLIGVVLIAVFANFQKNILKGIAITLSNLPLDIIGSFSDVVSYIRLFAVGFATVIVASSFNTMAIGSGINSITSGIIAAIVLLLGHALNMTLCGMSILVHGVRLNMLEFSGHVGVQWSGKPYKPFKE